MPPKSIFGFIVRPPRFFFKQNISKRYVFTLFFPLFRVFLRKWGMFMRFLDTIGTPSGGKFLLRQLQRYLPRGSELLELETPGQDKTPHLDSWYSVCRPESDAASVDYQKSHLPYLQPSMNPFASFSVNRKFSALYCNKLLHYYSPENVPEILKLVEGWLEPQGLVLFSLINKAREEQVDGIPVFYFDAALIKDLLQPRFKVLELDTYMEKKRKDSLYVLARLC